MRRLGSPRRPLPRSPAGKRLQSVAISFAPRGPDHDVVRLQFRLSTLMTAVALTALILGCVQAWSAGRRPGGARPIVRAIVAMREARRPHVPPMADDLKSVLGLAILAAAYPHLKRKIGVR